MLAIKLVLTSNVLLLWKIDEVKRQDNNKSSNMRFATEIEELERHIKILPLTQERETSNVISVTVVRNAAVLNMSCV